MDRAWTNHYDEEMTGIPVLPDMTLYEMLLRTKGIFPDRPAVTFEGTRITYSELVSEVDDFATALNDCNVGAGTVVTVCLPNIPQAVIAIYALNKLGAIANMVHPKTPPKELCDCMKQTGSECLLILDAFLPKSKAMLDELEPGLVIVCRITDYLSLPKSLAFKMTKGKKIPKVSQETFYILYDNLITHGELLRKGKINGDYDWPGAFEEEPEIAPEHYVRPIGPDDPALYLHSGGTTGAPKIAVISSTNMNLPAMLGPQIIRVPDPYKEPDKFPDLTMVAILPLFHGFGVCMCMHCMICCGINMLLVPVFKPDELAKVIRKEKPQLIAAVPTFFEGMMKSEKLKDMKLDFLLDCFSGGDTLPMDLKTRFEDFIHERGANISLREGYGLTETLTVCAVNPEKECRSGSVGLPLPGIDMKIVRIGTDEEVPIGERGEICISGPSVMLGYLNDPEATNIAVHVHADGRRWIHSGDLGHRDADGFFYFDQRIKRIIKVSGVPVFPTQIEKVLSAHPDVEAACAVAIPHDYRLHVVKAYIVLKDKNASSDRKALVKKQLMETCMQELIPYARPVEYEFRNEFPMTRIGKVDFRELEKEALAAFSSKKENRKDAPAPKEEARTADASATKEGLRTADTPAPKDEERKEAPKGAGRDA